MSKARLVITAVTAEKRPVSEVARSYGVTRSRTRVIMLIQDLHIRVINAATGELIRELTLDPARDYQPTGTPRGPKPKTPRP